ncbi:PREDICTED: uncharacterized protein LOC104807169 isoform X2 [Tarenaya hassleriana]|uniref:uncharacterized protein LOC104807169 isoform X2 n=1 Tax=Tarenaya hassleriana TaxID=28532 RepID=UPI00053C1E8A|nr:PREDICTED: uncharacterized protein LOC104807169 isoform X2 [Tarenaya hassleriana]
MAATASSSSVFPLLSHHFRSRKWTFSSSCYSSSSVFVRNRAFSAIKAAQVQIHESPRRRRTQNVDGDLFVDNSCIDCDTCRWMAPEVFTRVDGMSAVIKQPSCKEERLNALQALVSCPTGSIRTETPPTDILRAQDTFPVPVDEERLPGIYHCGFHSKKSYGAASYLILHPDGNILVDRDDVADHKKWANRFQATRILHSGDVRSSTSDVEKKLEGDGPWTLYEDIMLIHTPGHTEGSVCLFHKPLKVLFTGDHLAMTENGMSIFEQYNHGSIPLQLENVRSLIDLDFQWILPGHGRRVYFEDREEKSKNLEALVQKHLEKTS